MFTQRIQNNNGTDDVPGSKTKRVKAEYWNEVVIDGKLMKKEWNVDPSAVIQAIVWTKTGDKTSDDSAFSYAKKMQAYFKSLLHFTNDLPLVMLDATVDVKTTGPFFSSPAEMVEV